MNWARESKKALQNVYFEKSLSIKINASIEIIHFLSFFIELICQTADVVK